MDHIWHRHTQMNFCGETLSSYSLNELVISGIIVMVLHIIKPYTFFSLCEKCTSLIRI